MSFEEFDTLRRRAGAKELNEDELPNDYAYQPFHTRLDFEVSEFSIEAQLNEAQTNRMLSFMRRIAKGYDECTIKSHRHMREMWELASNKLQIVEVCFIHFTRSA